GQRTQSARDIDETTRDRPLQQVQHRLGNCEGAEKVGLEGAPDCFDIRRARRPIAGTGDAGIVDQNVEPSLMRFDVSHCGLYSDWIDQMDVHEARGYTFFAERCPRRLSAFSVARADQNVDSGFTELTGNLKADALVGAGDKSDATFRSQHDD